MVLITAKILALGLEIHSASVTARCTRSILVIVIAPSIAGRRHRASDLILPSELPFTLLKQSANLGQHYNEATSDETQKPKYAWLKRV